MDDGTEVIVAHSLGSVVAYEALCAHPEWPVRNLVTLGSPLGIRNLIFDQLVPRQWLEDQASPPGYGWRHQDVDESPTRRTSWPW